MYTSKNLKKKEKYCLIGSQATTQSIQHCTSKVTVIHEEHLACIAIVLQDTESERERKREISSLNARRDSANFAEALRHKSETR